MLTVLVSEISNSQVFLLKNVSSFCKCSSKNISVHAIFNDQSFNNTLTKDIVNFEQLGPEKYPDYLVLIAHNKRGMLKIFFLLANENVCCEYSL